MRILEGVHAGRSLTSPGRKVRPTAEPVRRGLFELIEAELEGARVLDLFAGSGALGLEALSRGAASVDFVENGPAALHALKANVAALKATRSTRIFKRDAVPWVDRLEADSYDVAFADPPYGSRKLDRVLARWSDVPFARMLVLEHDHEHTLPPGGERFDFGGPTRITLLRSSGSPGDGHRTIPGAPARDPRNR